MTRFDSSLNFLFMPFMVFMVGSQGGKVQGASRNGRATEINLTAQQPHGLAAQPPSTSARKAVRPGGLAP